MKRTTTELQVAKALPQTWKRSTNTQNNPSKHQKKTYHSSQPQKYKSATAKTATNCVRTATASFTLARADARGVVIVVDKIVLDTTDYISRHPGGREIIKGFAGQDCGWQWWTFHGRQVWDNIASELRVGRTEGMDNKFVKPPGFIGLRPFGYQDD